VLLLVGVRRRVIEVSLGALGAASARLGLAAAVAAGAGVLCGRVTDGATEVFTGGVVMLVVFVVAAYALGVRHGD